MGTSKGKILVIDDEQIIHDSCQRILSEEGYEVEAAFSGKEALEKMRGSGLDIVVTDLKMPGMSGLEALEAIREVDPDITVIMFTGYSTVQSAVEAMKKGAFDYIKKPFTPEELTNLINKAMAERKNLFERRYREDTFQELKVAIGSSLNLREVLDLIVTGVVRVMKIKGSSLSLLDKKRERWKVFASHGLSERYLSKGLLEGDKGSKEIFDEILAGRHVFVEDISKDSRIRYPQEAMQEGLASILLVPLIVKNKAIGALEVYTAERRHFSNDEIELLYGFAEQVALAIENAKSYEDVKEEYESMRDDLWDWYEYDVLRKE